MFSNELLGNEVNRPESTLIACLTSAVEFRDISIQKPPTALHYLQDKIQTLTLGVQYLRGSSSLVLTHLPPHLPSLLPFTSQPGPGYSRERTVLQFLTPHIPSQTFASDFLSIRNPPHICPSTPLPRSPPRSPLLHFPSTTSWISLSCHR